MPRIGRIIGLNALPLWLGLEEHLSGAVEFVDEVPGRLNHLLAAGDLEVSMVSAWHVATHPECHGMPGVAIAADGAVGSILILADTPAYARLHLTPHSATSAALCRALIPGVEFTALTEPVTHVLSRGEAALVIGDQALDLAQRDIGEYRTDVGSLWHHHTGLGMVYGRVAHRDGADPLLCDAVYEALTWGQQLWAHDPERVLHVARRRFPFPEPMMRRYLDGLRWDLAEDLRAGFAEFLRRAHAGVAS